MPRGVPNVKAPVAEVKEEAADTATDEALESAPEDAVDATALADELASNSPDEVTLAPLADELDDFAVAAVEPDLHDRHEAGARTVTAAYPEGKEPWQVLTVCDSRTGRVIRYEVVG